MSTPPLTYLTPEQYLEFERSSDTNIEYISGKIFPVEGGTPTHSLITANTTVALGKRLSTAGCGVYDSGLNVCADVKSFYVHADVTVVCGELQYSGEGKYSVSNPNVIVEVLSPTTLNYDLGPKARMYWKIASLTDLLFIDQGRVWIEYWFRSPGGKWDSREFDSLNDIVRIESTGSEIPIAEIYAGVEFELQS